MLWASGHRALSFEVCFLFPKFQDNQIGAKCLQMLEEKKIEGGSRFCLDSDKILMPLMNGQPQCHPALYTFLYAYYMHTFPIHEQ